MLIQHQDQKSESIRTIRAKIVNEIDQNIEALKQKQQVQDDKIVSSQLKEKLSENQSRITSLEKIKAKLMIDTEEVLRLVNRQVAIVKILNQPTESKS